MHPMTAERLEAIGKIFRLAMLVTPEKFPPGEDKDLFLNGAVIRASHPLEHDETLDENWRETVRNVAATLLEIVDPKEDPKPVAVPRLYRCPQCSAETGEEPGVRKCPECGKVFRIS